MSIRYGFIFKEVLKSLKKSYYLPFNLVAKYISVTGHKTGHKIKAKDI